MSRNKSQGKYCGKVKGKHVRRKDYIGKVKHSKNFGYHYAGMVGFACLP